MQIRCQIRKWFFLTKCRSHHFVLLLYCTDFKLLLSFTKQRSQKFLSTLSLTESAPQFGCKASSVNSRFLFDLGDKQTCNILHSILHNFRNPNRCTNVDDFYIFFLFERYFLIFISMNIQAYYSVHFIHSFISIYSYLVFFQLWIFSKKICLFISYVYLKSTRICS